MFEINLLRSFLAVCDTRSFTAAAAALELSQPTISQHIKRLETLAGQRLLQRDTSSVTLTPAGAVMARYAAEIMAMHDQAQAYFRGVADQALVRLGVSEDLALTRLPAVLRRLTEGGSRLQISLSVGLTSLLYAKLDKGELDLVLAKRREGDDRGVALRREPLAWMAHPDFRLDSGGRIPLVGYSGASITTALAMQALEQAGLPWRMACTSETLSGVWCGLQAGLGVSAQARFLLHMGADALAPCPPELGLPALDAVDFVLLGRSARLHGPTADVAEVIRRGVAELWPE